MRARTLKSLQQNCTFEKNFVKLKNIPRLRKSDLALETKTFAGTPHKCKYKSKILIFDCINKFVNMQTH